jgi:hypothetical protein
MPLLRKPLRQAFKRARHDASFERERRIRQEAAQEALRDRATSIPQVAKPEQPVAKAEAVAEPPVKTAHQRLMDDDEY